MKIVLSGTLQRMAGYVREHEVDAATSREALELLSKKHPALAGILLDGEGQLSGTHRAFLNSTQLAADELDTPVASTDTLELLTAIAGG
jgi:molybdopterin converting factor small subunit